MYAFGAAGAAVSLLPLRECSAAVAVAPEMAPRLLGQLGGRVGLRAAGAGYLLCWGSVGAFVIGSGAAGLADGSTTGTAWDCVREAPWVALAGAGLVCLSAPIMLPPLMLVGYITGRLTGGGLGYAARRALRRGAGAGEAFETALWPDRQAADRIELTRLTAVRWKWQRSLAGSVCAVVFCCCARR